MCRHGRQVYGPASYGDFLLLLILGGLAVGASLLTVLARAPRTVRPLDVALAAAAFFLGAEAFVWPTFVYAAIARISGLFT